MPCSGAFRVAGPPGTRRFGRPGCATRVEPGGRGGTIRLCIGARCSHTRKIAPIFFPIIAEAPISVTASSSMPQTPIALAMAGPSPRRSKST